MLGHYALNSQRVIPIEECPVHHPRGNKIAFGLASALAGPMDRGNPAPPRKSGLGVGLFVAPPDKTSAME